MFQSISKTTFTFTWSSNKYHILKIVAHQMLSITVNDIFLLLFVVLQFYFSKMKRENFGNTDQYCSLVDIYQNYIQMNQHEPEVMNSELAMRW